MSDVEVEKDDEIPTIDDDNAHQACYIFQPFSTDDLQREQSSKKRRKIKPSPEEQTSSFPLLNHGAEPTEFAQIRHDIFQRVWNRRQERIRDLLNRVDEDALQKITQFVETTGTKSEQKLPTGIIVSGQDNSAQTRLLEKWKDNRSQNSSDIVIQLRAGHCVNLQTTLKNVIRGTISAQIGQDGYQDFLNEHKRLIPMNFDLELLQIFVEEKEIQKIIISILDVETFDTSILSELLSMLSSWTETIPFSVLLGVATTVELFESRISKNTINVLKAATFTLQSSGNVLGQILDDAQNDPDGLVHFGPTTISALEELMESQGVTVESFTSAVKYAIMSHFFANSLSVLLGDSHDLKTDKSLCEAIRNTRSFQQYCEDLLRERKSSSKEVSILLTDDNKLLQAAFAAIKFTSSSASRAKAPLFDLKEAYQINSRQLLHPFTPRPRHALERALSKPADYLGCECCQIQPDPANSDTSQSPPPTSTLYTLLQEAGTVINVRDLYDAFCTRCFPKSTFPDDAEADDTGDSSGNADRKQMSAFYSALAELKMLGLVKSSASTVAKKRAFASGGGLDGIARDRYGDVDFVAKTGWAGL